MYIVIVGAGQVGSSIASSLSDSHEVTVIDLDGGRVEQLMYETDVLGIEGDGTDLDTLDEADIGRADILIASTDDDETNVITCLTADTASDAFTIARVRNPKFLRTWERSPGAFGVDHMVATTLLTAQTITQIIGLPAAQDVELFADDQVQMAEFEIADHSPIADQTVREADRYESLTFAAVLRDDEVIIPSGETMLRPGDDIIVIGDPTNVHTFAHDLEPDNNGRPNVMIIGGSDIGYHTAKLLQQRGVSTQLVERDEVRARTLAERLDKTTVLHGDPTDQAFLERERIGEVDIVVTTLDNDEQNLLVGLLAEQLGTTRTVAIVEDGDYVDLFEAVGIDAAVNPREATAEEITRFTRARQTENVAIIESDRAEVVEIKITADSVLASRPIRESIHDLPDEVVIGAITRDDDLVVPRGDTVIRQGDHVILLGETESLKEADDLI